MLTYDIIMITREGELGPMNKAEARNWLCSKSKADVFLFIDDDAVPCHDWVDQYVGHFENGADIVAGTEYRDGKFITCPTTVLYKGQDVNFPTVNIGYRRKIFEELGGFDTSLREAEDLDLNIRAVKAGYKITFDGRIYVVHNSRANWYGFLKQSFWYGYGRAQLLKKYGKDICNINPKHTRWHMKIRYLFAAMGYLWGRLTC